MTSRIHNWHGPLPDAFTWHYLRAEKLAALLRLPDELSVGVASRLISLSDMPQETQRRMARYIIHVLDEMLDSEAACSGVTACSDEAACSDAYELAGEEKTP
jgi:hypothetical protein